MTNPSKVQFHSRRPWGGFKTLERCWAFLWACVAAIGTGDMGMNGWKTPKQAVTAKQCYKAPISLRIVNSSPFTLNKLIFYSRFPQTFFHSAAHLPFISLLHKVQSFTCKRKGEFWAAHVSVCAFLHLFPLLVLTQYLLTSVPATVRLQTPVHRNMKENNIKYCTYRGITCVIL